MNLMKKFALTIAVVFGIIVVSNAQELKSKAGVPILPEAGDYAIGIDATPFLNYAGCFLSNAGGVAPTWDFTNAFQTIKGKYYVDATTAYRGEIRIGMGSKTHKNMVVDRTATVAPVFPALPTLKENKWKEGVTNIGIGAGLEKHRGKGRLSGYYGAGIGIYFASSKDKFTYGNTLSPAGVPPVVVDATDDAFTGALNITTDTYGSAARITERKNGANITLNLGAFVGAEYFLAPKVSLGGEFGWGLGFGKTGKTKTTTESIGGTTPAVGTQIIEGDKAGGLGFDTDNFGGTLYIMLHF